MAADDKDKAKLTEKLAAHIRKFPSLILDTSSGSRNSIRKLVTSYYKAGSGINTAENFSDGEKILREQKPHVLFVDLDLGQKTGIDFLNIVREIYPARTSYAFFMITGNTSPIVTSQLAEVEVDKVVIRPFSYGDLEKLFMEVMETKVNPSQYVSTIEKSRVLARQKKYPEAAQLLATAKKMDPKPAFACAVEAELLLAQNNSSGALAAYQEGLKYNPEHYRCALGLFDLQAASNDHAGAYATATQLFAKNPVNPSRIPLLIRLSILNKKYDNIMSFGEVIATVEPPNDLLNRNFAAGLVIAAKHFVREKTLPRALECLKSATKIATRFPKALAEIVSLYISLEMLEEAEKTVMSASKDLTENEDLQIAELMLADARGQLDLVLQMGNALRKKEVKNPIIWEILLKRNCEIKSRQDEARAIYEEATALFPQHKERFDQIRTQSAETPAAP